MSSELDDRIEAVIKRCRAQVEKHGGQSDELTKLRGCYTMLYDCPEAGALVFIEAELDRLEAA